MELDSASYLQQIDWDQLWKASVTLLCGLFALSWVIYVGAKHIRKAAEFTYQVFYTGFALIGVLYVFWLFQTLGILGLIKSIVTFCNLVKAAFFSS
jgi:hypothetical protein